MLALGVQDLLVFLLASGLVVPAARRLRVNPILGFLAVGIVVGPYGLNRLVGDGGWLSHLSITKVDAAH
jgi:CPA2 family monovalent cation:H+ antiporter-2